MPRPDLRAELVAAAASVLLGCATVERSGELAEPCLPEGGCHGALVCMRGICTLPDAPGDASIADGDAGSVVAVPDGAIDGGPWDASLVPPEPPPPPRDTGPRLPPPPEGEHRASPGFFDAALDWERHRLFLSQGASGVVEVVDLITGRTGVLVPGHYAENMRFDAYRDEIAVALPARLHSPYWFEDQEGYVTTIDPATLTFRDPIPIALDPWDVLFDHEGRLHVSGGSGQWTESATVDVETGQSRVHDVFGLFEWTSMELHPAGNRAYGVGRSIATFSRLSVGERLDVHYDAPHDPEHPPCGALRIAPDGRTIHTACGHVFLATNNPITDMRWTGSLDTGWRDLAFHPSGARIYLVTDAEEVAVYDAASLARVGAIPNDGVPVRVLTAPDYLVVLTPVLGGAPETRIEVRGYDED